MIPGFQAGVEEIYAHFHSLAHHVLDALNLGLDLPPNTLVARATPDSSELRLNHYPSVSKRELTERNTRRIWPHTDLGLIRYIKSLLRSTSFSSDFKFPRIFFIFEASLHLHHLIKPHTPQHQREN